MKHIVDFLSRLNENNNREWFNEHKNEYKQAESDFNNFVERLIKGISEFDPQIKDLSVKECTFRIYRDVRFSPNKAPYKTHMGAYICPKGKSSGLAGYYFHIEAPHSNYIGSHILAVGIHMPEPKVLKSIREEILDNGEAFVKAIENSNGFSLEGNDKLKKTPKDFPTEHPYSEYLKYKSFSISKPVSTEFIEDKKLLENCLEEFKKGLEYNTILNRAANYAFEEM